MHRPLVRVLLTLAVCASGLRAQATSSVAPFISPGFPSDLVSAKKADRIAWIVYERGLRNVYAASAPDFKPVRLTKFLADDGVILSYLEISDDGSVVTFTRGSES